MKSLPRVTIFLMSYNNSNFIEDSLNSCLKQDYKNLEIVISDDCSIDDTISKIKKTVYLYKGQHKITINENKENLGIGRHFAYLMENYAEGELTIICAGDDISKHNRVSRIVEEWVKNNKPSMIAHSLEEIDEQNNLITSCRSTQYQLQDYSSLSNNKLSIIEYLMYRYPIPFIGATAAYKTHTYKKFGEPKYYPDYEDQFMYFRSLLCDGIHFIPEKLIYYRQHETNFTNSPQKKTHLTQNSILSYYLNKQLKIEHAYIDCLISHKSTAQQWLDYKTALDLKKTTANYFIITELWNNLARRHKFLLKNKDCNTITSKIPYLNRLNTALIGSKETVKKTKKKISHAFNITEIIYTDNDCISAGFKLTKSNIEVFIVASKNHYKLKKDILEKIKPSNQRIIRLPAALLD